MSKVLSEDKCCAPAAPLLHHTDLCQHRGVPGDREAEPEGVPMAWGGLCPWSSPGLAAALPWLQQGAVQQQPQLQQCWATPSNNTTWPRVFYCIPAPGVPNCSGFHLSLLCNVACSPAAGHSSVITGVARSLFLVDFNNNIWNGPITEYNSCLQNVNPIERKQSFTYRPYILIQEHWQFLRQQLRFWICNKIWFKV